jgi:predicted transcriptional regulator
VRSLSALQEFHAEQLGLSAAEIAEYLSGLSDGIILGVKDPRTFECPIPLATVRSQIGTEPAQSFRYLTEDQRIIIERTASITARRSLG